MMYISVYPVVITMRNSNVYEERSLGIYEEDGASAVPVAITTRLGAVTHALQDLFTWHGVGAKHQLDRSTSGDGPESRISFISQQIQGQLAHDIWWLVVAVLFISTIETSSFLSDPATYSVFNIIFEVVSAYGCVGISVGLPYAAYSYSGSWHVASKLVLCAVMLRGRHRGLPVALDHAVRLPGERMYLEEEEDHRIRRNITRRRRSFDTMTV